MFLRYFLTQIVQITLHQVSAALCFVTPGTGLHRCRQLEKFGVEMVDGELPVIRVPSITEWIFVIAQRAVEPAAYQQAACNADGAQGIQAVSILDNGGLQGPGRDIGRVAMRLDGVKYFREKFIRVTVSPQEFRCCLGCHFRTLCT